MAAPKIPALRVLEAAAPVEILVVVPLEPLVALVALEETLETLAAWTAATVAKAATMVLNCIFSIVYRVAIV